MLQQEPTVEGQEQSRCVAALGGQLQAKGTPAGEPDCVLRTLLGEIKRGTPSIGQMGGVIGTGLSTVVVSGYSFAICHGTI